MFPELVSDAAVGWGRLDKLPQHLSGPTNICGVYFCRGDVNLQKNKVKFGRLCRTLCLGCQDPEEQITILAVHLVFKIDVIILQCC